MSKLLGAAVLAASLYVLPAQATILLDETGIGGTGNNVIFSSIFDNRLILGRLNGQNDEVVRFRDLTPTQDPLNPFTGSQNGNDIKIFNTVDLDITVFNSTNLTQLGVTRDVFSLVGTVDATVLFRVTALEADGSFQDFLFSSILKSGQNGFDFRAVDGERIWDLDLRVVGGKITDFEHFRIDVAPQVAAVPLPAVGAGLPGLIAGMFGLVALQRRRRARQLAA
jgi:hypothetical protein